VHCAPVTFYVTEDECRALQSRATDARLKLRDYVHSEMFGAPPVPGYVRSELNDNEARIAVLEEPVITLGLGG
jgi:hypothetical protein